MHWGLWKGFSHW